jgi:hypothetical protein
VNEGAQRYVYDDVGALLAGAVVARAVAPAVGFDELAVGVRLEGLQIQGSAEDHRPPFATAAAVRAAAGLVLLAVEGDTPVASAPSANDEPRFIDELQLGYEPPT